MSKNGKAALWKRSLLAKMLLFIGIPAAIIFCITAIIVLSSGTQSTTQFSTSLLTAESQSASSQINNYFSKYNETVQQMMANDLFQQYFQKSPEDKKISTQQGYGSVKQTVDNIYKTDPNNYADVWVADCATNTAILSCNATPYAMKLSGRPWYQPAVEKKGIVIIEPYKDVTSGKLVMSMIAPIYKTGTSQLLGFVGIDITTDQLYKTMQSYKLGKTGFYILSSAGGQLIYHPDVALKGKNVSESNMSKNVISAVQSKTAGAITYTAMGQTNYGYISPIGTTGWTITTGIPEKEFNSANNLMIICVSVIFVIAWLVLFILIVITSKSIVNPLVKLKNAANQIADGNLDVSIGVKSENEVGQVSTAFTRTVNRLKQYIQYIDEVSSVLDQIALGNLAFDLHCDYVGEFSKIKVSLDNIKSNLVKTFSDITNSAEQVSSGSKQVSNGAQTLAQGATEQASSIEELSATITEITSHVKENAEHAINASTNVDRVSSEIEISNKHMSDMVAAMSQINDSSSEIGKIIKTIEDIAFQTNILALNAAVEAARAGAAGKGFAVVADEVRNLASKSSEAVKNTTSLIENSMGQVENGTKIADETAKSLLNVMESARAVSETVEKISEASKRQSDAIGQVKVGVEQISSVVQTNSATAEESAAASEELSGQAQVLKELVGKFKL